MKNCFALLILLFLALPLAGQQKSLVKQSGLTAVAPPLRSFFQTTGLNNSIFNDSFQRFQRPEIGIFCKFDKTLDSQLPLNLRFRLGEYHYTRRLEYGGQLK
ncbi:MAG: hypothetical protein HKN16_09470 [Saprospiraceae bacterium]|nr:hypothetical protein [Saprospiraceae bacterium]